MSDAQLEHFESVLKTWKAQLQGDAEETKHTSKTSPHAVRHQRLATQEEEFALFLRTRYRERKLIRKLTNRLQTLPAVIYGFCQILWR